ncbi:hypothetical protein B9Z65_8401 [Elsinoe australis]|uniref:rRNA-processing protein EFG1 n=1 Tax=Elsinoe australis TaxID=40998 RepID=A0A2P7YDP4_9PEZI|nr:hypothetical protein B9Z65_8401 [Elsinoe australis]
MGTKRPHTSSHDATTSSSAPKKRKFDPSSSSGGKKPQHKPAPKPNPINPLRSRIRNLKRLLAHDDAHDSRPSARGAHGFAQEVGQDGLHPSRAEAILHSKDELDIAAKHERRDEKRRKRLPMNVRVERERELRGLEERLEEAERKRKRGEMVGRWHMVRFFERRRGERRLRRGRRELRELEEGEESQGPGEEEGGRGVKGRKEKERRKRETEKRVHDAEVDLNYALYWPLERAYVSLWPRKGKGQEQGKGEEDAEEAKGDREMWKLVERCMAEGTLEDLREGRVEGCGVERPEKKVVSGKEAKSNGKTANGKERAKQEVQQDDEESDDGFFE